MGGMHFRLISPEETAQLGSDLHPTRKKRTTTEQCRSALMPAAYFILIPAAEAAFYFCSDAVCASMQNRMMHNTFIVPRLKRCISTIQCARWCTCKCSQINARSVQMVKLKARPSFYPNERPLFLRVREIKAAQLISRCQSHQSEISLAPARPFF
jgi:hypothetical protein